MLSNKANSFLKEIRETAENPGLNYDDYGWGQNPKEEEEEEENDCTEVVHDSEEDD